MASLMELVDRVNKGEAVDSEQLEIYQESANSAEKFLAHHAHAMLDLRRGQQHMLQSLEAIDYSDQKVLNQFMSISQFLGLTDMRAQPVIKFGACAIGRREYALGLEAIQNGVAYDLANGGSYTSDKENCQFIATQYDRAAQWIGWNPDGANLNWNNQQLSVAYIVSGIGDDDWTGRSLRSLAKFHDGKRFKLQVFSTELLAGAGRNPILAPFAIIIGLLIWFNLVSQVYLVATSWSAIREEDLKASPAAKTTGWGSRQVQPGKTPVERHHTADHPRPAGVSARRRGTDRPTPR